MPPVESPGLGGCILTKDTESAQTFLSIWRDAVDAEQVADDLWATLWRQCQPTMPGITLARLAAREVARTVELCRDRGLLLHLVGK